LFQWLRKSQRVGQPDAAPPKAGNGPSLVAHERFLESDLSEIAESHYIEGHRLGDQPSDENAGCGWHAPDIIRNRMIG
jgi:hypothetical protein